MMKEKGQVKSMSVKSDRSHSLFFYFLPFNFKALPRLTNIHNIGLIISALSSVQKRPGPGKN